MPPEPPARNESAEEALLSRSRAGDMDAIRTLVERHAQMAFRIAYRLTGRREQAEDVAHDVLTRMLDYRQGWETPAGFRAWVRRAVVNRVIDIHRRRARWRWGSLDEAADIAHAQTPIDETVGAQHIEQKVAAAVLALPLRQRAAITLFYYEQQSLEDVAQAMATSNAAVQSLLHRAKETLKHELRQLKKEMSHERSRNG